MKFIQLALAGIVVLALPVAYAAAPESAKVTISGFEYKPSTVTVKKGGSVIFTNLDSAPHTVAPEKGAHFTNSGRMLKKESKTVTFSEVGKQHYFCDIHPSMKGVVNVLE